MSRKPEVRPEGPLDIGELIAVLARHNVDYVVIGGVATQVHGHQHTTMDLDLTPAPDPENLHRLRWGSRRTRGSPRGQRSGGGRDLHCRSGATCHRCDHPTIANTPREIHILKDPKGARPFDEMHERALVVDLDGASVAIVSLDDLIRMKRAAGRPRDLDDIATLAEVERQRQDNR